MSVSHDAFQHVYLVLLHFVSFLFVVSVESSCGDGDELRVKSSASESEAGLSINTN